VLEVEDVKVRSRALSVVGDDGPNRIDVDGGGSVDAGGGDDLVKGLDLTREVRVVAGPGADSLFVGLGSIDLRDGEADRIVCGGRTLRALDLDAGLDSARGCFPPVDVGSARRNLQLARVRPGGRVPFKASCDDRFHPCRARLFPQLTRRPSRGGGRHLPALTVRLRAGRSRLYRVRIPRATPPGVRYLRFAVRTRSPFRGVRPSRARYAVPIRVLRGR
jgi:hypothetical protein